MQNAQRRLTAKLEPSKPSLITAKSATDLTADPNRSYINALSSKNFQKYEVIVENDLLDNQLKCIQWRSKTQFPIVKILFYKILQKKLLNQCSVVQVAIQNFPSNLNTLPKMPFHQVLYLIKESLIGFERLFDRFGLFDITSKMILVNKNHKCRVWMNENITLNYPSKRDKIKESQFVGKLMKMFEEKCIKNANSGEFFGKIAMKGRIIDALQFLEMYIKDSKIVLANRLNLMFQASSPKKNIDKVEESLDKNDDFLICGSLKKIPKFVLQLREERKATEEEIQSKSFDSPKKRNANKDRSQAKTAINKQVKTKSQLQSQKSNISPISQISQDIHKETKSNNDKSIKKGGQKVVKPAVRELLKHNSQQMINTYATMIPISNPIYSTMKNIPKGEKFIKDLDLGGNVPFELDKRARKLSNQQSPSKVIQHPTIKPKPKHEAIDQCNLQISQQTAATHSSYINNIKLANLIQRTPKINIVQPNIYEKNGWMKRVNNLVASNNLRDTLHSHYDGTETFSDQYALAGQSLGLLGTMGKDLKGSIIGQ